MFKGIVGVQTEVTYGTLNEIIEMIRGKTIRKGLSKD